MFSHKGQKSLHSVTTTIKHQCPLSFSRTPAEEFKDSTTDLSTFKGTKWII